MNPSPPQIRNFCIIAHIDHGKSTLADRLLQLTGTISDREMKHAQILDSMDLEQEKGITIKLAPVRMNWKDEDGQAYIFNLIDTPGHVDFSYEVSRSLAAVEGALLVVDSTQGIQAQTLANSFLAMDHNLAIIPVINKIDLPAADVARVTEELKNTLGIDPKNIIPISAKSGQNVLEVLKAIPRLIPPPPDKASDPETKALIFDSVYDAYKGVVAFVRVFQGSIQKGDHVKFLHSGQDIEVLEVGYFKPKFSPTQKLHCGEIGYVVTGVKSVSEARVGDTLWKGVGLGKPLPGYRRVTPYVYAGLFPIQGDDYPLLRDALMKLSLNDSSLVYDVESSTALGHGFRCGFLGLLHMEIVQERLEREYELDLIATAPSVSYEIVRTGGEVLKIANPVELPDQSYIEEMREPWMKIEIITPREYIGGIMKLCEERRGIQKNIQYLEAVRAIITFELPLSQIIMDFYDQLKSISSGYASMNYEFLEYRTEDLVKLDMLVLGDRVDALSTIVHRSEAYRVGSILTKRLKEIIPRTQFEISLQAAIGAKIIARETISAMKKNVTAKLYGGDRTRKDKLLKKQKAGKKRMKMMGRVEIPQEAFLALLKRE